MLSPDAVDIVMVSFEGPDQYSQAGGLGVRAKEMCRAFAALGYRTTLVFVGDPDLPTTETWEGVRLRRWSQEISSRHPAGVYQGEHEKLVDIRDHLPAWLAETVVRPAAAVERTVVVLAEEWQTADFCSHLDDALRHRGLRDRCAILWNANNHFAFERLDWHRLGTVATVTTVSRYMKHIMWRWGVNPIVVPNGIPEAALAPVDARAVRSVRSAASTPCMVFKIGRFSPDKRWLQAVDAVGELRVHGLPARLVMRGGIEPHGGEVVERARSVGLHVVDWFEPVRDAAGVVEALRGSQGAAIVNLRTFLPDAVIPLLDAAATGVLANSGHEPFGLVGLEAMAAGGVAFVGATGEEYARPFENAVVVETEEPAEVASALRGLVERPRMAQSIRRIARRDAAQYTWPRVIDGLLERLRFVCERQRVLVG